MISVIIPCYNAERFAAASIKSILNQTYTNLEIVVIDDCSTDGTLKILQSIHDPRLQVHTNAENLGYLKTINKLLKMATGEFIAFQDADDISHSERLKLQMKRLLTDPTISLLGTNFSVIDDRGRVIRQSNVEETDTILKEQLLERNPFQKPSIMFRREVYEAIGGYREEFLSFKNISEDYDWLLRASDHFTFGNVNGDEPLYQYRMVSTAMTKDFHDIEQLFGHKIAMYLHQQRLSGERDAIERGDLGEVLSYIDRLKEPYLTDPSLFHHEKVSYLLYGELYAEAIQNSWAMFLKHKSMRNFRLILYCVKKYLHALTNR